MFAPQRHHVADLGCGRGDTLLEIAPLLGPSGSLVGVDSRPPPAPAPLAGDPRLTLIGTDLAEALPFEAGTFDRIVCQNVLECLADPDAFVSEIWRVLVSRGRHRRPLAVRGPARPRVGQRPDLVCLGLTRTGEPFVDRVVAVLMAKA